MDAGKGELCNGWEACNGEYGFLHLRHTGEQLEGDIKKLQWQFRNWVHKYKIRGQDKKKGRTCCYKKGVGKEERRVSQNDLAYLT